MSATVMSFATQNFNRSKSHLLQCFSKGLLAMFCLDLLFPSYGKKKKKKKSVFEETTEEQKSFGQKHFTHYFYNCILHFYMNS